MIISKPYLTLLTNLALAIAASIIASLTDLWIYIPLIFGFGVPLVNIEKPFMQKLGLTLLIVFFSVVIFYMAIITVLSLHFNRYILLGIISGLAGIALLGLNGYIIKTIKLNYKTILLTFLLSGVSWPIWIILSEKIIPNTILNIEFLRRFGVMLFWMTLTTIGLCLSIETEKK